jgi:ribosomal protein L5
MTATMILKEIHALPVREKTKLLKQLEQERKITGQKPVAFCNGKASEDQLLRFIEDIGAKMRTTLTAQEMNAARLEGRK